MSRRMAVLIGTAWLAVLFVVNAALLLRPESLRRQVDVALDDIFKSRVTYAEFEGSWPGDLVLRDVHVMHPDDPSELLASVDEIHIGVAWTSAAFGGSPVEEIRAVRPHLELAWNANGVLELPSPLADAGEEQGEALPRVKVEGMSLHLMNTPFLVQRDVAIELPDFHVSLIPEGSEKWLYQFSGSIDDAHLGNLDAFGYFSASELDLELSRDDFVVTPKMKEILQPEVAELLDRFKIDGDIQVVGELKSLPEAEELRQGVGARFEARIEFDDVNVSIWPDGPEGRPWPQALSRLRGVVEYAEGRFKVKHEVIGFLEGARLKFDGFADFSKGEPEIQVDGELLALEIDDGFVERLAALPHPGSEVREQLSQWAVRGPADLDFNLVQRPGIGEEARLIPSIGVQLKGCDLTYHGALNESTGKRSGFPYLLRDLWGKILLDDKGLRMTSLHASDGPMSLRARGTVDYSRKGDETYHAHVWVSGLVADERLYEAFDKDTAKILRDLHMQGSVDVQVVAERTRDDPISVDPQIIIGLNGLRLKPTDFPYLLEDARGQVVIGRDNKVTFESLTVRHKKSRLHAWGYIGTGPRSEEFNASFVLRDIPIDDELRAGLKVLVPEVVQTLDDLSARGTMEYADITVEGRPGHKDPLIEATLHLDGVHIAPKDPAVQIEDIDAVVEIWHRPGLQEVSINEGAKASIAGERFNASGRFRLGRDWLLKLDSKDFVLDDEMLTALEGVLPDLKDKSIRPKVEGHAKADVTIRGGTDRPTTVGAELETMGLKVVPPGWRETWLDEVRCKVKVDRAGFRVTELVARIPRPKGLPPLPTPSIRDGERPFQTEPAILVKLESAGISSSPDFRIGMTDVELSNVPLELWVLDVFGLSEEQRNEIEFPPLAGLMNLRFKSAVVGASAVTLLGGGANLFGIHLGGDADLYLEEGALKNFEFTLDRRGEIRFGGDKTELTATEFRLFGIPIPDLEAHVQGNNLGVTLTGIVGTLFGFDYDPFDVRSAPEWELRARAVGMRYLSASEARQKTGEQLRAIIEREESFDVSVADEAALREYAVDNLYVSRSRARRLDAGQLRRLIEEQKRARRLGVIWGETTNLTVTWDGEFSLDADLREVRVGPALKTLGAQVEDVRGRMNSHVTLGGVLAQPATWKGDGWVQVDGINLVQLPLFLNILKTLDPTSAIPPRTETGLNCRFDIRDSVVTLTEGKLVSPRLELKLKSPGTITFGGIIKARLEAKHTVGFIPIVSEILGFLPSMLLRGVVVEGPLEDPKVEPHSFDLGEGTPGTAGGRKPLMKPPRKTGGK